MNEKGITLVETLLYVALLSTFLSTVFSITFMLLRDSSRQSEKAYTYIEYLAVGELLRNHISSSVIIAPTPIATSTFLKFSSTTFSYAQDKWCFTGLYTLCLPELPAGFTFTMPHPMHLYMQLPDLHRMIYFHI